MNVFFTGNVHVFICRGVNTCAFNLQGFHFTGFCAAEMKEGERERNVGEKEGAMGDWRGRRREEDESQVSLVEGNNGRRRGLRQRDG